MASTMTAGEFRKKVGNMLQDRTSLIGYNNYAVSKTREDKVLYEEQLPLLAVLAHRKVSDGETVELGGNTEPWDARIGGTNVYEITLALPKNEHEERRGCRRRMKIDGQKFTIEMNGLAQGLSPVLLWEHANDHLQFPDVIIEAINAKKAKCYGDSRALIVAFSSDYSCGVDSVVDGWIDAVRKRTGLGDFNEILLVEIETQKVFDVQMGPVVAAERERHRQ